MTSVTGATIIRSRDLGTDLTKRSPWRKETLDHFEKRLKLSAREQIEFRCDLIDKGRSVLLTHDATLRVEIVQPLTESRNDRSDDAGNVVHPHERCVQP